MKLVNLTPHPIRLVTGGTGWNFGEWLIEELLPEGLARLSSEDKKDGELPVDLADDGELWRTVPDGVGYIPVFVREFGEITGLPESAEGVIYITSALVAQEAAKRGRRDVLAPDTGPSAVRDENGHIVAVRGLVRFA